MDHQGEVNVGHARRPARARCLQKAGESFALVIHLALAVTVCAGLLVLTAALATTWVVTAPMRAIRNWR